MKRPEFANNELYHICNRGVANLKIFNDAKDYLHFLLGLKEFNTPKNIDIRILFHLRKHKIKPINEADPKHPLVDIAAYCLMSNHFHLILRQRVENGMVLFMQKLGTGFSMYINKRHKISGHLFQGKFQATHITSGDQLLYTSAYIHLNPVKKREDQLLTMKMTEEQIKRAIAYPWSTLGEYMLNFINPASLPIELKWAKPTIDKHIIESMLNNAPYKRYLLDLWGKKSFVELDKKML